MKGGAGRQGPLGLRYMGDWADLRRWEEAQLGTEGLES